MFTAGDLDVDPIRPMPGMDTRMAQPVLAERIVRFAGEPVAVVVCTERYRLEDVGVELVDVEYDPLPALVDVTKSLAAETLLFAEAGTNVVVTYGERPTDDAE